MKYSGHDQELHDRIKELVPDNLQGIIKRYYQEDERAKAQVDRYAQQYSGNHASR